MKKFLLILLLISAAIAPTVAQVGITYIPVPSSRYFKDSIRVPLLGINKYPDELFDIKGTTSSNSVYYNGTKWYQNSLKTDGKIFELDNATDADDIFSVYAEGLIYMPLLNGTGKYIMIDETTGLLERTSIEFTGGDITGFNPTEILYGAADGTIEQSSSFTYSVSGNDNTISLLNTLAYNGTPNISTIYLNSTGGSMPQNKIWLGSSNQNSILFDGTYDFTLWQYAFGSTNHLYISGDNGTHYFTRPSGASMLTGIHTNSPLQDLHIVADTLRLEGLDGSGSFLTINGSGDVTRTSTTGASLSGFTDTHVLFGAPDGSVMTDGTFNYDVVTEYLNIGNGSNSPHIVLTGNGEAGVEFISAGTEVHAHNVGGEFHIDNNNSSTSTGLLLSLSNASSTGKIFEAEHNGTTKFQVNYTGATVVNKTSIDGTHAMKIGQNGVGSTGDILMLASESADKTNFDKNGRISLYAGSTIANGNILVGNGTSGDMELTTLTAGQDITITNAAGSITVANTFNLDAGTYTPTFTIDANLDAATATGDFMYQRIGNIVTVWGEATLDATASATTTFDISLPVASNFTVAATDAYGYAGGIATATGKQFSVDADTANDRVQFSAAINNPAAILYPIWFSYIVK